MTIININGRQYSVESGKTILAALSDCGVQISAPCSGNGKCGKCKVRATGALSAMTETEEKLLGADKNTFRLACMTKIEGEAQIITGESDADIMVKSSAASFKAEPVAYNLKITPDMPDAKHPVPADRRLENALPRGIKATETAAVGLAELQYNGANELYAVIVGDTAISVTDAPRKLYGLAVDVGTTTIAVYLTDMLTCTVAATAAFENPQKSSGADVISRIEVCNSEGSPDRLSHLLTDKLGETANELCAQLGIKTTDIVSAAVAGNTVMEHIFACIPPKTIAAAPFAPVTLFGITTAASQFGLHLDPEARLTLMPCVASYVGGDITAGIVAAGLYGRKGAYIYLDVGTNGEMALCVDGKMTFAATAAGPAFEGAHIEFGMSALTGAIRAVTLDESGVTVETVGNETVVGVEAVGICGSGLIDATAVFLEAGLIDETGHIIDAEDADERYAHYISEDGEKLMLTDKVYLSASDIREIQLAKAAVAAGIDTLLDNAGTDASELDGIVLAGGFGSNINAASACAIGLLPRELCEKVTAVGNTAGAGAVSYLCSSDARAMIRQTAEQGEYLELSGNAFFMDAYIDRMMFETE